MIRPVLLALVLVGMSGCGVRAPMTKFNNAVIMQSTADAIALLVEFDVSNTNDEPLHLKLYEYTVFANGNTVYKGKVSAEQTIPRWSTVTSRIPVVIRRDDLLGIETVTWRLSGSLGYVATSAFAQTLFNTGLSKTSTPVRAHGSMSISPID